MLMSFPNHWFAKPPCFLEEGPVSFKLTNIQRWSCIPLPIDFTLHKINLSIGERMIILHAGCNEGFVPNAEVVLGLLALVAITMGK